MSPYLRAGTGLDAELVANILIRARTEFMPYAPPVHPDTEIHRWVRTQLIPGGGVIVAENEGSVIGLMATSRADGISWIDQMAVMPERVGRGVGSLLLAHALEILVFPIRLFTFQANAGARRFYERHDFIAIELTDGSGNEERCPDMLYQRPAQLR